MHSNPVRHREAPGLPGVSGVTEDKRGEKRRRLQTNSFYPRMSRLATSAQYYLGEKQEKKNANRTKAMIHCLPIQCYVHGFAIITILTS